MNKQMKQKTYTPLSIFVSSWRETQKYDLYKCAIKEMRRIISNPSPAPADVLKLVFCLINNVEIDTMEFVKASALQDLDIKCAGYLGLSLSKQSNLLILMVNTIMKDLKDARCRNHAINFICNSRITDAVYEDLSDYICISNNMDKNAGKSIVAKSKLTRIKSYNLVGNSVSTVYVKIQIILDRLSNNEDVDLTENEALFLVSLYPTITDSFLKVKLVQMYKVLHIRNQLIVPHNFYNELEKDIVSASEKSMPAIKIGLSAELTDLFMMPSKKSQKAEHFVYRLINSINPNSRQEGFNLSVKHKFLIEKTIDRAIKLGIDVPYCHDALIKLINKSTHKDVYKRREEIRYILDKNGINKSETEILVNNVLLRILEYANDEMYIRVLYENPQMCYKMRTYRKISDHLRSVYFSKLLLKSNVKYFCLLYELMSDNLEDTLHKEIFAKHLSIICNKQFEHKMFVLQKCILHFCKFSNLHTHRTELVMAYVKEYNRNGDTSILAIIKNGIYFMNTKCDTKVQHLYADKFYSYKKDGNNVLLFLDKNLQLNNIRGEKNNVLKIKHLEEHNLMVDIHDSNYISLCFVVTPGKYCTKTIYTMKV